MDFVDFLMILGTHSEGFLGIFRQKKIISISRLLFVLVFGSKFRCQGLEKHAFGMEGIAKINFCRNWISYDLKGRFVMILGGLGSHFHGFCWPGGWLEN